MDENLPQNNHFPPIVLRIGLLFVLLVSTTGVLSSVAWIYHRVHNSLGLAIAEVVVAALVIVILTLVIVGFRAGFGARQVFRALWGYIGLPAELEQKTTDPQPQSEEILDVPALLDGPPKRGRPAMHSIDEWIPVVSAWENRDRWRNTLTLSEFLAERFGRNADGSPLMSANSYYDWKKRVRKELREREARKKKASA